MGKRKSDDSKAKTVAPKRKRQSVEYQSTINSVKDNKNSNAVANSKTLPNDEKSPLSGLHGKVKSKKVSLLCDSSMNNEQLSSKINFKTKASESIYEPDENKEIDSANEDVFRPIITESGEQVLEVQCGENKALLYLSKLCQGSKGACILWSEEWLTPNQFQKASGRQTAKDWKRSIRHYGKSMKLLLSKGHISIHSLVCTCMQCHDQGLYKRRQQRRKEVGKENIKRNRTSECNTYNASSPKFDSNHSDNDGVSTKKVCDDSDDAASDSTIEMPEYANHISAASPDDMTACETLPEKELHRNGLDLTAVPKIKKKVDMLSDDTTEKRNKKEKCTTENGKSAKNKTQKNSRLKDGHDSTKLDSSLSTTVKSDVKYSTVVTNIPDESAISPPKSDAIIPKFETNLQCVPNYSIHDDNSSTFANWADKEAKTEFSVDTHEIQVAMQDIIEKIERMCQMESFNALGTKETEYIDSRESRLGSIINRLNRTNKSNESSNDTKVISSFKPVETGAKNTLPSLSAKTSKPNDVKVSHKHNNKKKATAEVKPYGFKVNTIRTHELYTDNSPGEMPIFSERPPTTDKDTLSNSIMSIAKSSVGKLPNSSASLSSIASGTFSLPNVPDGTKQTIATVAPHVSTKLNQNVQTNSVTQNIMAAPANSISGTSPLLMSENYNNLFNLPIPYPYSMHFPYPNWMHMAQDPLTQQRHAAIQHLLPNYAESSFSCPFPSAYLPLTSPYYYNPFLTSRLFNDFSSSTTSMKSIEENTKPRSTSGDTNLNRGQTSPGRMRTETSKSHHNSGKKRSHKETGLDLTKKQKPENSTPLNLSVSKEKSHTLTNTSKVMNKSTLDDQNVSTLNYSTAFKKLKQSCGESSFDYDSCKCRQKGVKYPNIWRWDVEQVCSFLSTLNGCLQYVEIFRRHRIDGRTLPLLTVDQLMKTLQMSLRPAVLLVETVSKLLDAYASDLCQTCRSKQLVQMS